MFLPAVVGDLGDEITCSLSFERVPRLRIGLSSVLSHKGIPLRSMVPF